MSKMPTICKIIIGEIIEIESKKINTPNSLLYNIYNTKSYKYI